MRYAVKHRLTGDILYRTRNGDDQTMHERAERWCKSHLGERGEIIEYRVAPEASSAASAMRAIRSDKRAEASRQNGKKGGRPPKVAGQD
jgi:hypothetical protein